MKRTLLTLLSVLFCAITFAQSVPQGINYQAVARDANGDVLMNQALTIQFSVISDITTSAVSWQETHTVSTNDYGLYTAIIGQGTATSVGSSAAFDSINWGASNHLLKVEVDFGSGYLDMGTTAFMSVPYALYSANSGAVGAQGPQGLPGLAGSQGIQGPQGIPGPAGTTVTYSVGDLTQGGIVFYVTPDSTHGLAAATQDHSNGSNLVEAQNYISDPFNHSVNGQQFTDWRLPTKHELNQMYLNIGGGNINGATPVGSLGNVGGFSPTYYWSSTYMWTQMAWCQNFYNGNQAGMDALDSVFGSTGLNIYIRAVRAF